MAYYDIARRRALETLTTLTFLHKKLIDNVWELGINLIRQFSLDFPIKTKTRSNFVSLILQKAANLFV